MKKHNEYIIKRINLIGAFGNKWGAEYHVSDALQKLGYNVDTFDHRRGEAQNAIYSPADITLVIKGDGIHPNIIKQLPKPVALWYGELIHQRHEIADEVSKWKEKELIYNLSSFDFIFHHDYTALETIKNLAGKNVFWVSNSGVNPKVHKKLNISKVYDVGFYGYLSPRRIEMLRYLENKNINVIYKQVFGEKANYFINQCKIFINIHFSELLNTETRLHENLGAGTFALTEEISMPDMYIDGKHLIYWKLHDFEDLAQKIGYYLENEEEREKIAFCGHKMVHKKYKYTDRCEKLLETISKFWKEKIDLQKYGIALGVMFDKLGRQTYSISKFQHAIEIAVSNDECNY